MKKSHCDKVQFETKKEAKTFVHEARQQGMYRNGKKCKVIASKIYECNVCGKFHTSTKK